MSFRKRFLPGRDSGKQMPERPRATEALADWENEGGRIDTDPRDLDGAAGAPGLPISPARDEGGIDGRSSGIESGGHDIKTKAITPARWVCKEREDTANNDQAHDRGGGGMGGRSDGMHRFSSCTPTKSRSRMDSEGAGSANSKGRGITLCKTRI